ncbi:hypothetical protein FIBSPDRAFT_933788 [Athelia psychrophila]|uniref:Hemerythrin-like domain-containing protein n=1 Tax=Athelia psychrophila TaxID=1759441 RepID=A0A166GI90_9AGAM|nr:hypothetical protein FIBSPDRAFT_933788 [Fibularhizoctonia sp. CBS 109695]
MAPKPEFNSYQDSYQRLQWDISHAHDIFKRGIDNTLVHLRNPPLDDLDNFLGYVDTWAKLLVSHHDSEEIVMFPFLSQKMDMTPEIDAHKVIHESLEQLIAFIVVARENHSMFDAEKMTVIITTLKDPLYTHLDEEIARLDPDNTRVFEIKAIDEMTTQLVKFAIAHSGPWTALPFGLTHVPPNLKASFPEIPWVMKWIATPYILHWRYRGYWKYSPYGYR